MLTLSRSRLTLICPPFKNLYNVKIGGGGPEMTIFLILAPYGVFAFLVLVSSASLSLFAAAGLSVLVIAIDAIRGRSVKILGAGSAVLFTAVGVYFTFIDPTLSRS